MGLSASFTARSPAKLILSGEHAVVYGNPALAMSVNRYVESTVTACASSSIFFNLSNLKYAKSLTFQTLQEIKQRILSDYKDFLEGKCRIREVLEKPFELLQFTVCNLIEKLSLNLPHGVQIHTKSDIPIGCGMGSSAATIISVLKVLSHYLKIELDPSKYLSLAKDSENLQHGISSGLDLQLALQGGGILFQQGQTLPRAIPTFPMYLVNTGVPKSSTGECVFQAKKHLRSQTLLNEFEIVTSVLDQALQDQNQAQIQLAIAENHRLLNYIGVVPERVACFISELENVGAVAKISGAGSVSGDAAGMVLVVSQIDITPIVKKYGYSLESIQPDKNGTQLV